VTPIRTIIVDDEPMARQRLRRLIGARRDCKVVGEFSDGCGLASGLSELRPDLLLLDVQMPRLDGFASLARLSVPTPLVIFVTAFSEFAARAYDVDAVDYLLKPVSPDRLGDALARAARRLSRNSVNGSSAATSAIARFSVQGRTYLIEQGRISTLRAMGNYVEIATEGRRYELRLTLRQALAQLDPALFRQVHRSWIVSRAMITQITSLPGGRAEFVLKNGQRVPGGRAFQAGNG
jgi:two-component system, LytTR family, response regulator